MNLTRLITTASAAVLLAGVAAGAAAAQATATAKTEAAAQAATGKPTSDKPANTQPQGAAQAVKEGAAPAAAAQAGATTPPAAATAQARTVAPAGDLIETLKAAGQFSTFIKAVDSTNLTSVLKTYKNLTVFAPTDAAFAALPPGELQRLMGDKAALQKLLTHHIINAPVDSSKIAGAKGPVPSVATDNILLDGSQEGVLKADGATIVQPDVRATNGILHVVDRVLIAGQGDASTPTADAGAAETGQGSDSAAAAPEGAKSQQ